MRIPPEELVEILEARNGRRVVDNKQGLGIMKLFVKPHRTDRLQNMYKRLQLHEPAKWLRYMHLVNLLVHK